MKENQINYIPLVENYYFTADKDNYVLYRFERRNKIDRQTRKETDEIIEVYELMGYYTSLPSLIEGTIKYLNRQSIVDGSISTLKDCVKQIVDATKQLKDMLK